MIRYLSSVVLVLTLLSGCVAINGVANTTLVRPLPQAPTFQLINTTDGDPAIARKIGQMVAYQLLRRGFKNPEGKAPDMKVLIAFDVIPAGTTSTAFTTINQPQSRYFVSGDTVYRKSQTAFATTSVDTTQDFQKTIAIRIINTATGLPHWEGQVSETGWCNQIFVTAPNLLALMFEKFPGEVSNARKRIDQNDPAVQETRRIFPPDTNWECR